MTAPIARVYISGIGVTNIGSDIVFTINELSQGHWEAAIGFVPYIPATLPVFGKVIVKTPGGTVLGQFDAAIANAVKQALQLPPTIAHRFPVLQAAGATREQMRAFIKAGILPIPKDRGGLRRAMGEKPPGFQNAQAHHDFPWTYREKFAEVGIDVNNPQYGRWVEGAPHGPHQAWHKQYNAEWNQFFIDHPNWTVEQCLQKRQTMLNSGNYPAQW